VVSEQRQHVLVKKMYCGHRQLRGIQPAKGIAAVAVDGRLQIDLTDPFEGADEEDVHGDQLTAVVGDDMALSELRDEALEQAQLVL